MGDPRWAPIQSKITQSKNMKSSGEYDAALKLDMSMAADALGLQLMQIYESFDVMDNGQTGSIVFSKVVSNFSSAADAAGLHLMMDTRAIANILQEVGTQCNGDSMSAIFNIRQYTAAVILCGELC